MSDLLKEYVGLVLCSLEKSWVPEIDSQLLERAKETRIGRQWLVSRLSEHPLFCQPIVLFRDAEPSLRTTNWWRENLCGDEEFLLKLGGFVCRAQLRATVSREQVMQWRRVLGEKLHRDLIRISTSDTDVNAGESAAVSGDYSDAELSFEVRRIGYLEMKGQAMLLGPLFGYRVELAYPRGWSQQATAGSYRIRLSPRSFNEFIAREAELGGR
ncbi:hypothetical protein HDN1F_20330 [gamma proteobacterium HdN1]|nr:hypothetical protein HDN1F_20330 [gamma proteobacterium HdN1]